jgi:TPR repeat protein
MQESETNRPPSTKISKLVWLTLAALSALAAAAVTVFVYKPQMLGYGPPDFNYVKRKAEAGDPASLHQLGKCYENGVNLPRSYEEALRCYSLASEAGDLTARYDYACLLASGKVGSLMNTEKAFELLLDLAYRGNLSAQFSVAHYYRRTKRDANGRFDLIEAYAWANVFSAGMEVPSGYNQITYVQAGWSYDIPSMYRTSAFDERNSIERELSKEELSKAQKRSAEIFKAIEANRAKK